MGLDLGFDFRLCICVWVLFILVLGSRARARTFSVEPKRCSRGSKPLFNFMSVTGYGYVLVREWIGRSLREPSRRV